ncbi:MAG: PorV/PorQ family protein [candidate division KSB1 bacterium]|nr:PorV/PorQ family protein [candidate division KSB1 bacterium]
MKNSYPSRKSVTSSATLFLLCLLWAWLSSPSWLEGQIRSGAAFLQFTQGARGQGIASSLTGVIDNEQAVYANPAATGFLREWQWSATYAQWIAEVYSASVIYGQRIHTPWSHDTRVALGAAYLGMREFDSSDRAAAPESANDMLFFTSIGQRLGQRFAVGANIKYLRSRLAEYDAASWIVDAGALYRTRRFRFLNTGKEVFDYGILSAGVAVTQIGQPLTFISAGTPLPRTFRAGIAFNTGTHNGLQLHLTTDYKRVRDQRGYVSLGSEIGWSQILALRGGYDFCLCELSHFSFGLTLRLDDLKAPTTVLPGRNKAIRLDVAAVEDNFLFSHTYRGSVTHHAIGPEAFDFIAPAANALIKSDSVLLAWQATKDPDLYDDLNYWLLVDRDSLKLAEVVTTADRSTNELFQTLDNQSFLLNQKLHTTQFVIDELEGGDYYWTVLAYDRDRHIRFAGNRERHVQHFRIVAPELQIIAVSFDYSPWITEDDYQGILKIIVKNNGLSTAKNISFSLYDSLAIPPKSRTEASQANSKALVQTIIPRLRPGEVDTMESEWRTPEPGLHHIVAQIDSENRVRESDEMNNRLSGAFYTIPKGTFVTNDTVVALKLSRLAYEVPLIAEVCFERNSAAVLPDYLRHGIPAPTLLILAKRLQENRELRISLQGFADPNSGEHDAALAAARAGAVRDSLLRLGVNSEQISLLPGEVLPLRRTPADSNDARWVREERRYVKITADSSSEAVLFQLVAFDVTDSLPSPVVFNSAIMGTVPLKEGMIAVSAGDLQEQININPAASGTNLRQAINWHYHQFHGTRINAWVEKNVAYSITLIDTLGRQFHTKPRLTYLAAQSALREQRVAWPIKFQGTTPLYDFYWSQLLVHVNRMLADPNMRMRFSGHACAVGPEPVNLRLSRQRAEAFHQNFLRYLKLHYPQVYEKLLLRLDPARGFGENRPLRIERLNGEQITIGDNDKPLGRKFNRRLEIEFYYPSVP